MATMSDHLVLARKWRPERFADLVGQEQVTRTLAQALASGRIAHAFLFSGIRGVGKTTAARILARCLNCAQGPTPEPCGQCAACVEIRQGRALDVVEIDGATYRKIDDARSIIENLSYRPARDRFKIYIIDEAHQLTDQAFNALLKTLEEPPPHVKFILATTEPQKMPETILSRLQRYDFRRLPFAVIMARLRDLAQRENIAVDQGGLTLLAREAGGSMRDAERMLESALTLAEDGPLSENAVADTLGVASRARVYALTTAILERDAGAALNIVRELNERGANLAGLGRDLLETLRNLVIAKLPANGQAHALTNLPDHELEQVRKLAQQPSQRDLLRLFRLMAQAQEEILRSPYADLLLEMTVVRMASLAPVLDGDELARALAALGREAGPGGGPSGTPPGPSGAPAAPARRMRVEGEVRASAPARTPLPTPPSPARPGVNQALPELREHIRARKAALAGFMENGATLRLDDDLLRIIPASSIYVRYLADNRGVIGELAAEFYGRPIRVELAPVDASGGDAGIASAAPASPPEAPTAAPTPASAPGNPATPAADRDTIRKELFADPVVRQILDELEGRLVDVRRTVSGDDQSKS
ncbi:MAG TPA: DNA polymerase III subunit gamma/tau [Candidatus Binataceae bacterium]|nr:DNA polymerase III subunit gamma/tau [Candidatus Binataceae bacterium]